MNILVINCGSSSIKYKLYKFNKKTKLLAGGIIEKIGHNAGGVKNHDEGVRTIIERLIKQKIIVDFKEIAAVGHRVVHGGETFWQPHLINKEVIAKIKECSELAPLHNPPNLAGIKACQDIMPRMPQVAVFDTAFHHAMPEYAYMYPIPVKYYKKYSVRKYGFHGTSHQYVASLAAARLGRPLNKLKLITCHLGNGCSITAVNKGKSVDTSMGFTPLEGLMMGTRSGDIDVAAVFYIMEKENITWQEMDAILNRKSGLLGISGVSNDMRDIIARARRGRKRCRLAVDMFLYRIKKYIGAYYMVLGGADAVVITAGIGENSRTVINALRRDIAKTFGKKTRILVLSTNEEFMIADLTYKLVSKKRLERKARR